MQLIKNLPHLSQKSDRPHRRYNSVSDTNTAGNYLYLSKNKIGSGFSSVVYRGTNIINGIFVIKT
jgi:hypothetical protein